VQYVYTQSSTLQAILQDKLPVLTLDDPLFQIMPINGIDASMVVWEQRDNYTGLMSARGYDGGFGRIQREGIKTFKVEPGKYGDQKLMSEEFLTVGREIGTFANAINIERAQQEDQNHLLNIAINRLRKIGWDFLINGIYSVPDQNGQILATDTVTLKTFTSIVPWTTPATSTPLADMRQIKLLARGSSTSFGRAARLYVQAETVNAILANTNPADLGGRRVALASGEVQPLSLDQVNRIMFDQDLPMIVEYERGYQDSSNVYQPFIPAGKGVVVGPRESGDSVMEFIMTRNANNLAASRGATEMYYDFEFKKNPVRGISTLGFNGAPAVYYPGSVVKCSFY